ncbi:MAG: substrate-binding domain-containing protein [Firmicutes bacterium]|nr:substrate-binding domain-containing protein [Bacillota bacterium]
MKIFNSKAIFLVLASVLFFTACQNSSAANGEFNSNMAIAVVSREDGSGTRAAFIELLGIDRGGVDHTFIEADIQNSGGAVLTAVAANMYSIGYISLGSLNETVASVSIDGVSPTPSNVRNGSYPLFRSFYFVVDQSSESPLVQDFINFVLSAEAQEIAAERGYIPVNYDAPPFAGSTATGNIVISGSTSVFPIVEVLGEAFTAINPNARIDVHSTGSSAGITAAIDGIADIGMSSRTLHDDELAQVAAIEILFDGLAVIVNSGNPILDMSAEVVQQIFEGNIVVWRDLE